MDNLTTEQQRVLHEVLTTQKRVDAFMARSPDITDPEVQDTAQALLGEVQGALLRAIRCVAREGGPDEVMLSLHTALAQTIETTQEIVLRKISRAMDEAASATKH